MQRPGRHRKAAVQEAYAKAKDQPCADCGGSFPSYVMEFDHIRGRGQRVSVLASQGASVARLLAEIAKCDLVCANCHCVRTHNRRIEEAA